MEPDKSLSDGSIDGCVFFFKLVLLRKFKGDTLILSRKWYDYCETRLTSYEKITEQQIVVIRNRGAT